MNGLYQKKPELVHAWKFNGQERIFWPTWLCYAEGVRERSGAIVIPTVGVPLLVEKGEWIVLDAHHRMSRFSEEKFKECFDKIEEV